MESEMQNEMLNVRSEYIIQVISPKQANGEKAPVFNRELTVIIPRVRLKKATSSVRRARRERNPRSFFFLADFFRVSLDRPCKKGLLVV